jgi:hypothetical protein
MPGTPEEILAQLERERRTVAYDAYDIIIRQLIDMVGSAEIDIAPDYQRQFVWKEDRESELIESIFLGIPIPSLYMAVNAADGKWEVVDGVQRLSTILHFHGSPANLARIGRKEPLRLQELTKLAHLNGASLAELPGPVRTGFLNRAMRVTTLNDRSDYNVRFDLFERLNTGGVTLHMQEIRNIVYRGEFRNILRQLSTSADLRAILKLPRGTGDAQASAEYEEAVLRFFAFLERYQQFGHLVTQFLNSYMQDNAARGPPQPILNLFEPTVAFVRAQLPRGILRGQSSTTPINLYEAVVVGTALVCQQNHDPREGVLQGLLNNEELRRFSSAGSNSRPMVVGRIEFVRNALV